MIFRKAFVFAFFSLSQTGYTQFILGSYPNVPVKNNQHTGHSTPPPSHSTPTVAGPSEVLQEQTTAPLKKEDNFKVGDRVFSISKKLTGTIVSIEGSTFSVRYDGLGDSGEVIVYKAGGSGKSGSSASYTVTQNKFSPPPGQVMDLQMPKDLMKASKKFSLNGEERIWNPKEKFYDLASGLEVTVAETFSNGSKQVVLLQHPVMAIPRIHKEKEKLYPSASSATVSSGAKIYRLGEKKDPSYVVDKKTGSRSKVLSIYQDPKTSEGIVVIHNPLYAVPLTRRLNELDIP